MLAEIIYFVSLPLVFVHRYTISLRLFSHFFAINWFWLIAIFYVFYLVLNLAHKNKQLLKDLKLFWHKFKYILILFLVFILLEFLHVLVSINHKASFIMFLRHIAGIWLFPLTSFVIFRLSINLNQTKKIQLFMKFIYSWVILFLIDIFTSIFQLIDCFYNKCYLAKKIQLYFNHNALPYKSQVLSYKTNAHMIIRIQGLFGDTNFHALFLAITFFVLLTLLLIYIMQKKFALTRLFISLLIIVDIIAFLATASRSAIILGFVLGFVFFAQLILYKNLIKQYIKTLLASLILIILIFLIPITIFFSKNNNLGNFMQRRVNLSKDPSALTHLLLFKESLNIVKKSKPGILGKGLGTYNILFQEYIKHTKKPVDPHCEWLKIYIEQGVIGTTFYLTFFIIFFIYLIKAIKSNTSYKINQQTLAQQVLLNTLLFIPIGIWGVTTVYYGLYMPYVWAWGWVNNFLNK